MICVMRRMEATPILVCGRDMQTWALGLRLIKCGDQVVSAWTWAPSGCIFCLGFLISEIQVSVLMEAGPMRQRRPQVFTVNSITGWVLTGETADCNTLHTHR